MSDFLLNGSYLAIVLVLVLTGMGLPIPEEVAIIAAGVLSSHRQLDPWLAFLACLIGALLGDCASYWIGYHFGTRVIREHHWWNRYMTPARERKIEEMIRAHGLKVFFLARFLIGLRSTIYLTAGVLRMPFRRFILIDLVCATVIIGIFFELSYQFGEVVTRWIRGAEWTVTAVLVGVVAAVVIFFLWRRSRRKLLGAGGEPSRDPSARAADGEDQAASETEHEHAGCGDCDDTGTGATPPP
jgi:membrane protein DedA with SNARE-associated domain